MVLPQKALMLQHAFYNLCIVLSVEPAENLVLAQSFAHLVRRQQVAHVKILSIIFNEQPLKPFADSRELPMMNNSSSDGEINMASML